MIAILDYRAGNLTSVKRALDHLDIPNQITSDPEIIDKAPGIIFPGVGAAGSAMRNLKESGLDSSLMSAIRSGKPMLGICLGCQIILDKSLENNARTLGIVPGECRIFSPDLKDESGRPINIPHMGWNRVRLVQDCPLFKGIPDDAEFYFVHSYYPVPDPGMVIGMTTYGLDFCSVFGRPGLWAMQFHPEKSGRPGLKILSNFYAYCLENSNAQ
ncbi:imidazole glycerol phosphate synthase subunit HisH [Desulfonatronovibrio hydrogenovorans]|uniref:imidazole glycerol phosphate synthase subunit HisH n=1 Tax=Desulfonatronovibrio hydrogenovorans TaxID=53245 RepID=UPI0004903B6E|nr:imidazole glycerol phosphate synthase subunit HisH [Desulfonatronovibrio hydrogenovorans]